MTVRLSDLTDADPFVRDAMRGPILERASGEWLNLIRHHLFGYRVGVSDAGDGGKTSVVRVSDPPDVGAAVLEAIEAARALHRHERRKVAALRRKGAML